MRFHLVFKMSYFTLSELVLKARKGLILHHAGMLCRLDTHMMLTFSGDDWKKMDEQDTRDCEKESALVCRR